MGALADDPIVHSHRGVDIDERCRVLRVDAQPQHQWVEDPLDCATQRPAVVAAEYFDPGSNGTPRAIDHRTAWLANGYRRDRLEARVHRFSIKLGSVAGARADADGMSTASLLGIAAVLVAGSAAALSPAHRTTAPVRLAPDEAAERLVTVTDVLAVDAAFDAMLVKKGLLTGDQLELIRHGTRSRGVVTGMRPTGASCQDHREVVLDVIVRKPGGGQFPAHETALIPASSLAKVSPGSIIDAYYHSGDESSVAVCVSPS